MVNIKINKSTNNINKLRIYLRAVAKFGKTSLFKNMILEEYNGDASKGLLISLGSEFGETLLDDLQCTHVDTWKELKELTQWLVKEKGKEHNIEFIALDTIDELIPIGEREVMRLSQLETGKPAKSINMCYNGFGQGQAKLKEIVKDLITTLYKAGFGIMAISHTKIKTIVEKNMNPDEGYMVLTSNLSNTYENVFSDIFDMILTGTVEKTIIDGKINGTERRLYFRGDGYVEAGTRFANDTVPEYLVVDNDQRQFAKDFLKTIKDGMRNSASTPLSDEDYEKAVVEEKVQSEEELKEVQEELAQEEVKDEKTAKKELMAQIKEKANTSKKKSDLIAFIKSHGKSKVSELTIEELEMAIQSL